MARKAPPLSLEAAPQRSPETVERDLLLSLAKDGPRMKGAVLGKLMGLLGYKGVPPQGIEGRAHETLWRILAERSPWTAEEDDLFRRYVDPAVAHDDQIELLKTLHALPRYEGLHSAYAQMAIHVRADELRPRVQAMQGVQDVTVSSGPVAKPEPVQAVQGVDDESALLTKLTSISGSKDEFQSALAAVSALPSFAGLDEQALRHSVDERVVELGIRPREPETVQVVQAVQGVQVVAEADEADAEDIEADEVLPPIEEDLGEPVDEEMVEAADRVVAKLAEEDEAVDDEEDGAGHYHRLKAHVLNYMREHGVEYLYDGTLRWARDQADATDLEAIAGREPLTRDLLMMYLRTEARAAGVKSDGLVDIVQGWMVDQRVVRRKKLFHLTHSPVANPQPGFDALRKMAEVRFVDPPEYVAALIEEIIWQTKRKWLVTALGAVEHPYLFLFYSHLGGTGKSELTRRIASPLADMTRTNVQVSDLTDPRHQELWDSLLLVIDDVGKAHESARARLKAIITGHEFNFRPMRSNKNERRANRTTLEGSSNLTALDLFGDTSGMRRYAQADLREDRKIRDWPEARAVTDDLDWSAIWRGIDHRQEAPFVARDVLGYLEEKQRSLTPAVRMTPFERWVAGFSIEDKGYAQRINRSGWIRLIDLWTYCYVPAMERMREIPVPDQTLGRMLNQTSAFRFKRSSKGSMYRFVGADEVNVNAFDEGDD